MGKVVVKIKLTNLFDLGAQHRKLSKAKPRSVEVEALVEEPVDGPMLLQTIRELLAEPVQSRMRRTYYQVIDFRHMPPGRGDFRDLLHQPLYCSVPLPLASVPMGDKRMNRGEGAPARKTYYEIPSIQHDGYQSDGGWIAG